MSLPSHLPWDQRVGAGDPLVFLDKITYSRISGYGVELKKHQVS